MKNTRSYDDMLKNFSEVTGDDILTVVEKVERRNGLALRLCYSILTEIYSVINAVWCTPFDRRV